MQPSQMVKPPRVKESPIQMECKVKQVIELGQTAGAGNLVICEIILIHVSETVLNEKKFIDQHKLDLVGRLGANWYVRASSLLSSENGFATVRIVLYRDWLLLTACCKAMVDGSINTNSSIVLPSP